MRFSGQGLLAPVPILKVNICLHSYTNKILWEHKYTKGNDIRERTMKSGKKSEKNQRKHWKKKLSSNITTIILILIFLVGLSVMLYPTVSNYINQRHQSKAIAAYDEKVSEMKPEDYTKYFEAAEKYNKKFMKIHLHFITRMKLKVMRKYLILVVQVLWVISQSRSLV